jgi:hypothetical protein
MTVKIVVGRGAKTGLAGRMRVPLRGQHRISLDPQAIRRSIAFQWSFEAPI